MDMGKYIFFVLIHLIIVSCSVDSASDVNTFSPNQSTLSESKKGEKAKYLAYTHSLSITLPKADVETSFNEIIQFCAQDTAGQCTVLHSSLNAGEYSFANIQLRILPDGVNPLFSMASKKGDVSSITTDVEDLQEAVVNNEKRLEMLLQYQARLIKLEEKSSGNIESLIKLTQELSQVQSDIEYANGDKAKLLQRIQMDIVDISLRAHSYGSFWGRISDSLAGFGENLSEGISLTITVIAYLLPWLLIIMLLVYVFRVIWRKTRNK